MSERPIPITEEQRARQRDVLGALLKASGMQLTPAAAKIGVSASTLSRYVSGETILPTPYYQPVADAFGLSFAELSRRLLPIDEPATTSAEPWDFEAEVAALEPLAPTHAADIREKFTHQPPELQRVAVEVVQMMLAASDTDTGDEPGHAIAKERAEYRAARNAG